MNSKLPILKNEFRKSLKLNAEKVEFIKKLQTRDYFLKRISKDFKNKIQINGN